MEKNVILKIEEIKDLPVDVLFKKIDSSNRGLSSSETENRIKQYGYNELYEKKMVPLQKI
jgi:H+-transporting ATPase